MRQTTTAIAPKHYLTGLQKLAKEFQDYSRIHYPAHSLSVIPSNDLKQIEFTATIPVGPGTISKYPIKLVMEQRQTYVAIYVREIQTNLDCFFGILFEDQTRQQIFDDALQAYVMEIEEAIPSTIPVTPFCTELNDLVAHIESIAKVTGVKNHKQGTYSLEFKKGQYSNLLVIYKLSELGIVAFLQKHDANSELNKILKFRLIENKTLESPKATSLIKALAKSLVQEASNHADIASFPLFSARCDRVSYLCYDEEEAQLIAQPEFEIQHMHVTLTLQMHTGQKVVSMHYITYPEIQQIVNMYTGKYVDVYHEQAQATSLSSTVISGDTYYGASVWLRNDVIH